ncbi:MAG TPA: ankyrin repeat domain-containing protein [Capsulimonadaceae bacterium]|nr:ankyrin repeat domain-containing protein [Capsulimonadaceae bacterium]
MTDSQFGAAPNIEHLKNQAKALLRAIKAAEPSSLNRLKASHPDFASAAFAPGQVIQLADAQLVIAREYGFPSWPKMKEHVDRTTEIRALIETAMECVNNVGWGQVEELTIFPERRVRLEGLLRAHPELAKIPVDSLGFTLLHRAAWGNSLQLAKILIDAGAGIDTRANDLSTPLTMALASGYGKGDLAALLAERTTVPLTLRLAAGLGLDAQIGEFFDSRGRLTANAIDDQASYYDKPRRDWNIARDRAEILTEALTYAARNDQLSTMQILLDLGAPIDGEPYYGAALHWAAFFGKLAAVHFLVEAGADKNKADCQIGGSPAGWGYQFGHKEIVAFLTENSEPTAE